MVWYDIMGLMKDRVLVVIPAYNEVDSISRVLGEVERELPWAKILVVNDCSTDGTETKIGKGVKIINNTFNMGYAMSMQTGIKYAERNGFDYVLQMDADGQHLASEAKKMLDTCKDKKADIVLGSRYYKGSTYKAPFFRRFGTRLFEFLIRVFCRKKITDPLTGFQCINRKVIEHYAKPGNYPEYPDAGLIIEMLMKKYKIIEVPVKMKKREAGESMHSGIISPIVYMATQLYSCVVVFIKFVGRKYE